MAGSYGSSMLLPQLFCLSRLCFDPFQRRNWTCDARLAGFTDALPLLYLQSTRQNSPCVILDFSFIVAV
jgi:hypothetical protein